MVMKVMFITSTPGSAKTRYSPGELSRAGADAAAPQKSSV